MVDVETIASIFIKVFKLVMVFFLFEVRELQWMCFVAWNHVCFCKEKARTKGTQFNQKP